MGTTVPVSSRPRARQTDVEVLRRKRIEADRSRRDDVLETVVEPRRFELDAAIRQALLDARFEAARAHWHQIEIPRKGRRAERLQDRWLLDAQPSRGFQLGVADRPAAVASRPRNRRARHHGCAEAVVVFDTEPGRHEHVCPQRLMLHRIARIVPACSRDRVLEHILEPCALAVVIERTRKNVRAGTST